MAKKYLATNTLNYNHQAYGYENVLAELDNAEESNRKALLHTVGMAQAARNADDMAQFEDDIGQYRKNIAEKHENKQLLAKYPDEFPVLYSIRERSLDEGISFEFREKLADIPEIIPEAWDIISHNQELELACRMEDGSEFGLTVEPYDRAGENERQYRGRINFSQKAIDELNESRLKQILDFCEKHGFSIYDIDLPVKDGIIDLDEKLASLTQKLLDERKDLDAKNPGPEPHQEVEADFNVLEAKVQDITLDTPIGKPMPKSKKPKSFEDVYNDMIEFLEKDIHKTRGLSYFEHGNWFDGKKTIVFSLYDKPNKNNEDMDGLKDKNGNYVPTYSHRLYISQDPETGGFVFGYATPGGKKMDDVMAGDFIGVIKKTGVTHIDFSNLPNVDKGVWMMACAEKGIVPIGISINVAKAKAMVEAARKKLTTEELVQFKRYLSEQMLDNAKAKKPDDKNYGLAKSEMAYIQTLRAGYDFENFRLAYEDDNGLYAAVIEQIDKGSRDSKEGAARTFGAMQTLRTVFDIYDKHQYQTFGDFLNSPAKESLRPIPAERAALNAIPLNKPMMELSASDFTLIYNTLLPREIEKAKEAILKAYARESARKGPKRADNIVLSNDLFPSYKGALNEINIILSRNKGLETLTLPNEHKGLDFARPDELAQENVQTSKTPVSKQDKKPNIVETAAQKTSNAGR